MVAITRPVNAFPVRPVLSNTAAAVPDLADLATNEVAINFADGIIYAEFAGARLALQVVTPLNDTLTSTATNEALTAAQGKNLQDQIDALPEQRLVADIAGRDALPIAERDPLTVAFVQDDGDGKWARYQNLGTAAVPVWQKIQDEDSLNAGLSATNLGYTPAPAQGTVTNTSGSDSVIPPVDATNAGLMVPADKTKLDSAVNSALAYTPAPAQGTVTNTAGTDATIPPVDATNAGLMLPADKAKLDSAVNSALAYTATPGQGTVTNTAGTDATLPLVDQTNAGLMGPSSGVAGQFVQTTATGYAAVALDNAGTF